MPEMSFSVEVILSLQRALWDLVTPRLRGIAIRVDHPVIHGRFIYEKVTRREIEIVSEVEAYVSADFLPPIYPEFRAIAIPKRTRRTLEDGEFWTYLRAERTR